MIPLIYNNKDESTKMISLEKMPFTKNHVPEVKADFLYEINALRAFAVLAVMAYHFGIPGFSGGFSGVDVFFVISGFLIGSQIIDGHLRGNFSYSKFYVARLRRIFPALLVVVVVCLLWGWLYDLPRDYINANRHAVSALFFVSNFAFDGERGYFDAAAHTKTLLHTWSLSVEGQFYLFLPAFIGLSWRFFKRHFPVLIGAGFLLSLGWCIYISQLAPGKGFYWLSSRAWEFLAGVMVATLRHRKPDQLAANLLGVIGLVALLASFFLIDASATWPGGATLLPVAAAAVLVLSGDASLTRPVFSSWPLQRIGDISYSLYLWHWPVWVISRKLASMAERELGALDIIGMVALSLLLGSLSWKFVEQPIRNGRGWWSARRVVSGVFASVVVGFGFGLTVVATHGIPARLPSYVQRAVEATFTNTPRDECFRRGDSTKDAPEQFCRFGLDAKTEPSLMLWGDSHANQYLTAVSAAASSAGLTGIIATQSACAARDVAMGDAQTSCDRFNMEVNQHLAQAASLRTVILGRWWSDENSLDISIKLIEKLLASGKTVILIGPLPVPGFDVPERWSVLQIQQKTPIEQMVSPLSSQTMAQAIKNKLISALEVPLQENRVILIDPMQRLCKDMVCRWVENGVGYFRDESHLSHAASLMFTREFTDALHQLAGRR